MNEKTLENIAKAVFFVPYQIGCYIVRRSIDIDLRNRQIEGFIDMMLPDWEPEAVQLDNAPSTRTQTK